ncbi:MAG: phenylalanine--tRNA ligase subunit alpha [Fimbriimonadaceae bacterium]|nr:phenylalanine--tRNA ligase subunit alpha [Fimbriimonadaceae bacterium]
MEETLLRLEAEALAAIAAATDLASLEEVRIKLVGKKGAVTLGLPNMRDVPADQKRLVGQLANRLRQGVEEALSSRRLAFEATAREAARAATSLDLSLPGRVPTPGRRHPLTLVLHELVDIFAGFGFQVVDGPEVELSYYNFTALAIPEDHPARDDRDSFYINQDVVLRTETSAVQVRYMETHEPPVRIIAPGRVYRRDAVDSTHSHTFHQVEGLLVDRGVSFADLKGILYALARGLFGEGVIARFTPDYFPFTEPSAQMGIWRGPNGICTDPKDPAGRWLEILGCGMVDPQVLANVGYDSEEYTGFAFGVGLERLAILKYGIDDIRLFFENDLRFSGQF